MPLLRHIDRERGKVRSVRAALHSTVAAFLAKLRIHVVDHIRSASPKVAKASARDGDDPTKAADWSALEDAVQPKLEEMAQDGGAEALRQVDSEVEALLAQVNERAVAWSKSYSARLVTAIQESTRDAVRDLVAAGLEAGKTNDEIADEVADSYWFGDSRALTIARTETAQADTQGNVLGWKASGVVAGKEWLTSDDPCEECAALSGEVAALDEEFDGGDPPLHPRCECVLLPVLAEED